jgi:hypothetical protein
MEGSQGFKGGDFFQRFSEKNTTRPFTTEGQINIIWGGVALTHFQSNTLINSSFGVLIFLATECLTLKDLA